MSRQGAVALATALALGGCGLVLGVDNLRERSQDMADADGDRFVEGDSHGVLDGQSSGERFFEGDGLDGLDGQNNSDGPNVGHCDPCSGIPVYGLYCGTSKQSGFNANGSADPNTLYVCNRNAVAAAASCANGCIVREGGIPDQCSQDPCQFAAAGRYCGRSTEGSFRPSAASPDVLYECGPMKTVATVACGAAGCRVAEAGLPDTCVFDPCSAVSTGRFCGTSTKGNFHATAANAGLLYTCIDGSTAWTQPCPQGCDVAKQGQDDGCLCAADAFVDGGTVAPGD